METGHKRAGRFHRNRAERSAIECFPVVAFRSNATRALVGSALTQIRIYFGAGVFIFGSTRESMRYKCAADRELLSVI